MKIGKDDKLHYTKFKYTIIVNGMIHRDISYDQIEDGLLGDMEVDRAILRTAIDYHDQRCWHIGNGDPSKRNNTVQRQFYDIPVTLIVTYDGDDVYNDTL